MEWMELNMTGGMNGRIMTGGMNGIKYDWWNYLEVLWLVEWMEVFWPVEQMEVWMFVGMNGSVYDWWSEWIELAVVSNE